MGSTEPNQPSISSGIPLPQWMKSKINDRYDVEQPFSPPSHDDTFFFIRYPKSSTPSDVQQQQPPQQQQQFRPITDVLEKHPDFSKHTPPCRQFIPQAKAGNAIPEIQLTKPKKSQGTDDGFHGEGAACGKSVVHVAQQMMAGKFVPKTSDSHLAAEAYDFNHRRGSKSLPASPLSTPHTSPRLAKKSNQNPYFTGCDKTSQEPKYQGWILAGFLGQREQQLSIPEENTSVSREDLPSGLEGRGEPEAASGMRRNKSTSVIGRLMRDEEDGGQSEARGAKVVRPKASGLREMNFWSPTSM